MGAGASIEGDEPVDKAKAEILAGGAWVNMEAKFDAEASEEGFVSAQRCRELLAGDAAGAEEKEAVALSANESFCTETDVQDDGVQAMMRMVNLLRMSDPLVFSSHAFVHSEFHPMPNTC